MCCLDVVGFFTVLVVLFWLLLLAVLFTVSVVGLL